MIELAQHIEALLLENDCVIVPGLGGFVAHYTPAMRVAEENTFLPPTRIIGFNPQLKMNDGLLVQSYMAVYDTDFSDATRIVGKSVKELLALLHENGKADLPNIGELRYNIHDSYDFTPYDDKLTTPYLYGLGSFEMQELAVLHKPCRNGSKTIPFAPVVREEKKRKYGMRINTSYLANAVAMIAVAALFFFLPAPVENTEVMEANYARLLPGDLFGQIEKQSLAITPIVIHQQETGKKAKTTRSAGKKPVAPVAVTPIGGMTVGHTAFIIAGSLLILKGIDDFVLQPTLYSERVKAHPLEIFLVILIAGSMAGILGMLLAIPSYTVLRVFAKEFFSQFRLVRKLTEKI